MSRQDEYNEAYDAGFADGVAKATPTSTEYDILDEVLDRLTSWMTDHCPHDEMWEDFAPHVDGARSAIAEIMEEAQKETTDERT
jgi:hypothetical protein